VRNFTSKYSPGQFSIGKNRPTSVFGNEDPHVGEIAALSRPRKGEETALWHENGTKRAAEEEQERRACTNKHTYTYKDLITRATVKRKA